jgi:hypothetical protein
MKKITIDDLAVMIAKGFSAVDKRFDRMEAKLDDLEAHHDRRLRLIEKIVLLKKSA